MQHFIREDLFYFKLYVYILKKHERDLPQTNQLMIIECKIN